MSVLVTRPIDDSLRFAADLAAEGIDSLIWPLTRIVPCPDAGAVPDGTDLVLFTSRHGVDALSGGPRPAALCVGRATAEAAKAAGFDPVQTASGTSEGLAEAAIASGARRIFYPRAEHVTVDLASVLGRAGIEIRDRVVYRAAPADPAPDAVDQALRIGALRAVTVWSQRNAALLSDRIAKRPDWQLQSTDLVAISAKAASPLQKTRFGRILVAEQRDRAGMVQSVFAALRQKSR